MSAVAPHLRFASDVGEHLFVSAYSRLFDLAAEDEPTSEDIAELGLPAPGDVALDQIARPAPQAISLNVSAGCNLACGYCYAGRGEFAGRQPRGMDWPTARAAVDRLLGGANPSHPITVGFLGGEPFVNAALIHRVTEYAAAAGSERSLDVRFSVTTNATLLRPADHALLRSYGFGVTVSIDGDRATHDRQRPQAGGRSSWDHALAGIAPLLADPVAAKIAARVTVTLGSAPLETMFDALCTAGFDDVGLSPLRSAPAAAGPIAGAAWADYLAQLTTLADRELARLRAGHPLRLSNLAVALRQIHRGACSPFPCGAGGGYFSVGADGDWYACHRAIGDDTFRLGDANGIDEARREAFLRARHVDAQTDCAGCWARHLCSGGCHQELAARTSQSCDFVRGWLRFCLTRYCELDTFRRLLLEEPGHA